MAKCSHRLTMLRFRHLVSHKNSLIISDFFVLAVLMALFARTHRIAKCSFTSSKLRFRSLAWHKNSLIISDFFVLAVLMALFARTLRTPNLFCHLMSFNVIQCHSMPFNVHRHKTTKCSHSFLCEHFLHSLSSTPLRSRVP